MSHESSGPPVEPPSDQPSEPQGSKWKPDDIATAAEGSIQPRRAAQSELDGCLAAIGKGVLILFIGIFVITGLVFATCFLSIRR